MVFYVNSQKKSKEEVSYYPYGNVERISFFVDGKQIGAEKIYSDYEKKMMRYTEYLNDKKVNDELIYNKQGFMIYKIRHIDDNVYTLTRYDKNYKSAHSRIHQ